MYARLCTWEFLSQSHQSSGPVTLTAGCHSVSDGPSAYDDDDDDDDDDDEDDEDDGAVDRMATSAATTEFARGARAPRSPQKSAAAEGIIL